MTWLFPFTHMLSIPIPTFIFLYTQLRAKLLKLWIKLADVGPFGLELF